MIIIDRLTSPASVIAMTTSIFSKRRIFRRSSALRPTIRRLGQRRVQVDDVGHHRRADDPGGEQDALGAVKPGMNRCVGDVAGVGLRVEDLEPERRAATTPTSAAITASSRRKPRCWRARIANAPAPAISAAGKSGIPNSRLRPSAAPTTSAMSRRHRDHLGLDPEADRRPARERLAAELGEVLAGRDAELRRLGLDHHRDQVRREDDPEQQVAELRPGGDVGREVAGVDVGDRGDERRPEERPEARDAREPGPRAIAGRRARPRPRRGGRPRSRRPARRRDRYRDRAPARPLGGAPVGPGRARGSSPEAPPAHEDRCVGCATSKLQFSLLEICSIPAH